jgi:hypothetical protein
LEYSYFSKKEAFDFRKAASIQPWDLIKYLSLVLMCADDIEAARPRLDKNIVFSYRFLPNAGFLFNGNYDYRSFTRHVTWKLKQGKYKLYIKADIANYYDRLNLHRLENVLLSYCKDKKAVKIINQLLLFWANRDSYDLPVGSNASRILAEAELIDVDNYLLSKKIDFARFVDDYRIFANDAKEAHYLLNLFIARLSIEGLSVNTGKTSIEEAKKFLPDILDEEDVNVGTEQIIEQAEEKRPSKLIVGYSGLIPTKFRKPLQSEVELFQKKDISDTRNFIINEEILNPEIVRDFVKFIVINNSWDELEMLLSVIDKFPQFTPYISDVLIKYKDNLDTEQKYRIRLKYQDILQNTKLYPEYIYLACVNILTEDAFSSKAFGYNLKQLYRVTG